MRAPVADHAKTPSPPLFFLTSLFYLFFFFFCSPHPSLAPLSVIFSSSCSSAAQGSPVKKRGVGRWRLSEEGRREAEQDQQRAGAAAAAAGFESSPLRSNHNPFSPDGDGRGRGSAGGGQVTLGVCVLHCVVVCCVLALVSCHVHVRFYSRVGVSSSD